MTLKIDPNTQTGKIQIEAIGWAQDQMNEVLQRYFENRYRLMKGLRLEFNMRLDGQLNQTIKVEISELAPDTQERFDEAVEQAKANLPKPEPDQPTVGEIVEEPK